MSDSNELPDAVARAPFGRTADGRVVEIFTLQNQSGMTARIMTYGAILVSLTAPDRDGNFADVILGYDRLEDYLKHNPGFGAVMGRYANRIGNAQFSLNGKTYSLPKNNGENCLHGGFKGFDKVVWTAAAAETDDGPSLTLAYFSKDGEEGFPGNVSVKVIYTLTHENELRAQFSATTDAPTVCNFTNHAYFNLAGRGDALNHELQIHASRFTPINAKFIPTGEIKSVTGTPFDFRQPQKIGARLRQPDAQLQLAGGYDHNLVLDKPPGELALAARAYEPASGRVLEVLGTAPGIQLYTANSFNGSIVGKGGQIYHRHAGFCLESENFPDAPNQPQFPSAELQPGQTYRQTIVFRFSAK